MSIIVVNKNSGEYGYYIGRPTVLGNPYPIGKFNRRQSIDNYRKYAQEKMRDIDSAFYKEINKLKEQEIRTGEVRLQCFCAPQECHGDVIKEILDAL